MARRRANGEGTITKRKDGRWQGAITIGYDEEGKQQRKTVYGKTQAEARSKLDELKQQAASSGFNREEMTLTTYLERWLQTKERQVKHRTIESYAYSLQRYVIPRLGAVTLSNLTPLKIQMMLGAIADEVSPHTSRYCHGILGSALNQAVRWGLLQANPVEAVDKVRVERREMTIWSTAEITRFLTHAEQHRLYPLFYLAITSGLRIGELLALSWNDVNGNILHVRHNLTKQNGKLLLATTKTSNSQRAVTLAADAVAVLQEHRKKQRAEQEIAAEAWEHPDHLFTTSIGTFLDHRNVLRVWHQLQKQAEVPRARLHDTRHLHVSLLVRHGLDARTIADRVGHADAAFTLRQYTHLFEEQRLAAAVPLDDLLANSK